MQDTAITKADSISDKTLNQLKDMLSVGQEALNEVAQDRILRGIKAGFENISYRYQNVDPPFKETFEWIFDLTGESPEATKFTQWLSSENGIFHICGKLGSGKSTLSQYRETPVTLFFYIYIPSNPSVPAEKIREKPGNKADWYSGLTHTSEKAV